MPRSPPTGLSISPDVELETSNCANFVLNAYTIALLTRRNEPKAIEAAIRAWRERNPKASRADAAPAVEDIIRKKL